MKLTDMFKRNKIENNQKASGRLVNQGSQIKLMTSNEGSFTSWNGSMYNSDIIRSIIRTKSKVVGKIQPRHIRTDSNGSINENPQYYMKLLLESPNELMSMQQLLEKMITQLELNNNAFVFIQRDIITGYPTQLIPINATSAEALRDVDNTLYLRFRTNKNKQFTAKYSDIIHLRNDYNNDEVFGTSNHEVLHELMDVINTVDKGIVSAIKNSNVIQWLLQYEGNLKDDDIKSRSKVFNDSFLNLNDDSNGVAVIDNKVKEAKQVEHKSIVPNTELMSTTRTRILSLYGMNENIIQAKFTQDEWTAFYETIIEPIVIQLNYQFTTKLFTTRERQLGNAITFETSDLTYTSLSNKLLITQLVDRGIITKNEARAVLKYVPVEGGEVFVRRLDTVVIDDTAPIVEEKEVIVEEEAKPNNVTKPRTKRKPTTKGGE